MTWPSEALTRGAVHVLADDVSGSTWADEHANSRDATITGASTETTSPPGTFANFLSFDGSDDHVASPIPGFGQKLRTHAVEMVVRFNDTSSDVALCGVFNDGGNTAHHVLANSTEGSGGGDKLDILVRGESGSFGALLRVESVDTMTALDDGEWHHLVVVVEEAVASVGSSVRMWVDKTEQTDLAVDQDNCNDEFTSDFNYDWGDGARNIRDTWDFHAQIDLAARALYDVALTQADVDALYGEAFGSGGADHELAPADATHSHTASTPTLTQTHALAPQDASHSHAAGEPALTQAHQFAPADSSHSHTVSEPALTQVHALAPDDASHAHEVSSPSLTQHHTLTPSDATHSHTASEPALTLAGTLAPEDAVHAHTASEPGITQHHQLAPADATHGHVASEPTLTVTTTLTPDDASHLHTTSEPGLTQVHVLDPDDGTHSHTADEPTLSQLHRLAPQDATHTHTATSPGLTSRDESAVTPASRTLTVEAEDRRLVVAAETRVLTVAHEDRILTVKG